MQNPQALKFSRELANTRLPTPFLKANSAATPAACWAQRCFLVTPFAGSERRQHTPDPGRRAPVPGTLGEAPQRSLGGKWTVRPLGRIQILKINKAAQKGGKQGLLLDISVLASHASVISHFPASKFSIHGEHRRAIPGRRLPCPALREAVCGGGLACQAGLSGDLNQ